MPKVSVIMGIYNGANRLSKSVSSIVRQTFSDWEFVICDDGSRDGTYQQIVEWSLQDNRIVPLRSERNMGLAYSLNKCLEVAKGEYIARMDDDDISHEDRFKRQVLFLESHREYAIVGTGRSIFDNSSIWGTDVLIPEPTTLDIYLGRSFVHPSVMIQRKAILDVGGYTVSKETWRTEDYDLWCKLYASGYRGYNLKDILLDYHEARDSYRKRKYKYRVSEYRLRKKWRAQLGLSWKYAIYAYRPLVVGVVPKSVMMKLRAARFSRT